jgi:hypothetical protein
MKIIKNRIIIVITIMLIAVSCDDDFLDGQNPNEITADVFFQNATEVEQAVNTLYNSIRESRSTFMENARSGENNMAGASFQTLLNYYNFGSSPQDGDTDAPWSVAYNTIFRANTILENIDNADFGGDEVSKQRLLSETYFFRGLSYFQLAHMYGKVPIVLSTPVQPEDFNPPAATTFEEVWNQAITDLQLAKVGLPPVGQTGSGRVTKGTATGFLGKAYLYRAGYLNETENYALAAAQFKEVIDSGEYALVDNYVDNFTSSNENNSESLYEFQMLFNASQETPVQGRPFNSVPGVGFEIFLRPSDWLMTEMALERTVDGEFDPRYLETVYFNDGLPLFGVPYNELGDGITCEGGGAPDGSSDTAGGWWRKYLNVDQSCPPILLGLDPDNNERVLRYADILLMYAEAVVMASGDINAALDALNTVRGRANLADFSNTAGLEDEIKHQRILEFTYENMRYFDLIRWGELITFFQANGVPAQRGNVAEKHKYFPIPVLEVLTNENLDQSEPWK